MSITVYNISGSPMGWRVLLGLAFKELDYNIIYLSGSDEEHKQSSFLEKNPHGKVPVLEYEGAYYRESLFILGWLDQQFPSLPLFGKSIEEVSTTWICAAQYSDYLLKATNEVVFPVFNGVDGSPTAPDGNTDALSHAGQLLKLELGMLESLLANDTYLQGEAPTAADAIAYPEIARVMRAVQTKPCSMSLLGVGDIDASFPSIARWRNQIASLPGYQKTVPPHWANYS